MGAFGRWRRGNKFHGSSFLLIFSFLCEMVLDEVKHIYKNTTFHKMNIYCKRGKRSQLQLKEKKKRNKPWDVFFFFICFFRTLLAQQLRLKMRGPEATGLLSLENSQLFLYPIYLIDSQHLSGSQSISLSLLLHHSHFWQLNTRSKSSVTQTHDTVNLCNALLCKQLPRRLSKNGLLVSSQYAVRSKAGLGSRERLLTVKRTRRKSKNK